MEQKITNEELKIMHKVINYRKVKKEGFNTYRKKILTGPQKRFNDWYDIFMFSSDLMADILPNDVYGEPYPEWGKYIITHLIAFASSPLLLAITVAYFPIAVLKRAIYECKESELEKLRDCGIYDILIERIGNKTYNNPDLIEQTILSDIEIKGRVK